MTDIAGVGSAAAGLAQTLVDAGQNRAAGVEQPSDPLARRQADEATRRAERTSPGERTAENRTDRFGEDPAADRDTAVRRSVADELAARTNTIEDRVSLSEQARAAQRRARDAVAGGGSAAEPPGTTAPSPRADQEAEIRRQQTERTNPATNETREARTLGRLIDRFA